MLPEVCYPAQSSETELTLVDVVVVVVVVEVVVVGVVAVVVVVGVVAVAVGVVGVHVVVLVAVVVAAVLVSVETVERQFESGSQCDFDPGFVLAAVPKYVVAAVLELKSGFDLPGFVPSESLVPVRWMVQLGIMRSVLVAGSGGRLTR